MELGMIGLGRMGANMTERLVRDGHRVVGFDPKPRRARGSKKTGAALARSPTPSPSSRRRARFG